MLPNYVVLRAVNYPQHQNKKKNKSSFGARGITPKYVTSVGSHLRGLGSGQHRFEIQRNIAAVASRWRHCALFD